MCCCLRDVMVQPNECLKRYDAYEILLKSEFEILPMVTHLLIALPHSRLQVQPHT